MGTTTILKNVLDRKPMVAFTTQYALEPRHFELKVKDLENINKCLRISLGL